MILESLCLDGIVLDFEIGGKEFEVNVFLVCKESIKFQMKCPDGLVAELRTVVREFGVQTLVTTLESLFFFYEIRVLAYWEEKSTELTKHQWWPGGSMECFGWIVRGYMDLILIYRKNEVRDYDKSPAYLLFCSPDGLVVEHSSLD